MRRVREGRRCRLPSSMQLLYETWVAGEGCMRECALQSSNSVVTCASKPHAPTPEYFKFTQYSKRIKKNKRRGTAAGEHTWEGWHPRHLPLCQLARCSLAVAVNVLPTHHMSHMHSPNPVTQLCWASAWPGDNINFLAVLHCCRCLGR